MTHKLLEAAPTATPARRARVLSIEDDSASREVLRRMLERSGFEVEVVTGAAAGLRTVFRWRPDLVLLDTALPDASGITVLGRIREMTDVPVLILSARGEEDVKVAALRAGADDYVTKPCGFLELLARIEVLLRRSLVDEDTRGPYSDPVLDIDYASLDVRIGGKPANLTARELRLLLALVDNRGQVLSADQLLDRVWGDSRLPRDRVKLYVAYLREKFREAGVAPPIETVRGFGYLYRPPGPE